MVTNEVLNTVYFMEWSHGLEFWIGAMEWSTGVDSWELKLGVKCWSIRERFILVVKLVSFEWTPM